MSDCEKDAEQRKLAKMVADELITRIQKEVGKSILNKIFWLSLAGMIALGIWLGAIKSPV
jgi:hypothetical protein|tara:strand:- start:302 stop:481 length:180 start_codon:yes stop_codon:yes gene_type:complete